MAWESTIFTGLPTKDETTETTVWNLSVSSYSPFLATVSIVCFFVKSLNKPSFEVPKTEYLI